MSNMDLVEEGQNEKGRMLRSVRDVSEGDVLLKEKPLVCSQFAWNKWCKYRACEYCIRSMESPLDMARRLSENDSMVLPHLEADPVDPSQFVQCPGCGTEYCSRDCYAAAVSQYHRVLCPETAEARQSIELIEETWRQLHEPPETTTIWLPLKILGMLLQAQDSNFARALDTFCCDLRRDDPKAGPMEHKLLRPEFEHQREVMREMCTNYLRLRAPSQMARVEEWLTVSGWQRLFAILGQNSAGIGTSSLNVFDQRVTDLSMTDEEKAEVEQQMMDVYDAIMEEVGECINSEGSGLFLKQSACNHSCVPNAEVRFSFETSELQLVALEDIPNGQEVTISYIEPQELRRSQRARQQMLRENYLFVCGCEKCIAQADNPDESDEESSCCEEEDLDLEDNDTD